MSKNILVTGGNSGIGFALCKLLATGTQPDSEYKTPAPPTCKVFLGSRSLERGEAAMKTILDEFPDAAGKIEVLQIDVTDDASCAAAAAALKEKEVCLYALVNNAGLGLNQAEAADADVHSILNTNYYGPKRVTEAMMKLIDPKEGRIVNTSSGGAAMYLKKQNASLKAILSNPDITLDELEKTIKGQAARDDLAAKGYGFSKAALNGLTLVYAKAFPHLKVVSLSPGFIDTAMVKGWGAKLTPEQGCVSGLVCLFDEVTSGYFYGSDGVRSPFTMTRDPGMPAYEGEDDPTQEKYNK